MKAKIKQVTHGKQKGQFRFVLKGDNGEIVGHGETYTSKSECLQTLNKYFPNFQIVDETKPQKKRVEDFQPYSD